MAHLADMSIRLEKTWMDLDGETIASLPAQLGVYHVADADGTVLSVGYAGATHLFGIRSALEEELAKYRRGAHWEGVHRRQQEDLQSVEWPLRCATTGY